MGALYGVVVLRFAKKSAKIRLVLILGYVTGPVQLCLQKDDTAHLLKVTL